MNNIIEIKNLTYKNIFKDFNLNIEEKDFITVIGPNDSGKTTLVKILSGLKEYSGKININNLEQKENIKEIRKNISFVFDNPENSFIMDTVYNDLLFTCKNKKINNYQEKIDFITNKLNINHLLNRSPHELSGGEKQKVALANALITNPSILIIDEGLTMIDAVSKSNIYAYLQELNKNGLTVINITNDIEESLNSKTILVINKGQIVAYDTKENIYKQENIFIKLKIKLPFIIELSDKLKLYELIKEDYFSSEKLINKLW